PVVSQPDGSPIVASVRIEYSDRTIPAAGTFTLPLEGAASFVAYPTSDMNTAHSKLTVRDNLGDAKTAIPSDKWAFGTCTRGAAGLVRNETNFWLFDGFQANRLYELIYPAKNPIVMGLAYAVTRDIGSFLRYETADDSGNPNPLAMTSEGSLARLVYGYGASSTGMYMREFLYLGFNEDEDGRKI